ncbi:ATP-binding cassette domain-containing protein [Clostridium sp. LIBA-8841]|uniref:ATP-binding cassette domain-containing protein n=1 Tax=Clostridium sp. LIBA-8841 TaxID=2987530 RepID=UPI002AC6A9C3|nr:ATP-binding cassette domain-containing protein [Clostridium sp. LIBA-8841]MDZ5253464.1 ATP-binding cassette domain-containing protein [Clostridium sp. LIBA-8841]
MENIISVRNLNKRYGKKIVLDNLNMNLKKGDIYGLVGKNGAGKTTLIRMILSLANIDSGEIELFGKIDEKEKLLEHKKIGNIIETPAFYSFFTAKQNLEYYRIQRGIVGEKSIDEVLEMVGLGDVGNKKFKKFSLGMKQRLGLALALLGEPELLILDEPTNGMDPMGIREVREVLLKLNKLNGVTILVSSHILGELSQLANCYGFLKDGKIVEEISEEELNEKCRHHLLIKVDDCKRASIILEQALKNNSYEILPDGFIKVYRELDNPQRINRALVEGGVDVYSLERVGVNLEDYFINLIGGENNA